MSTFTPQNDCLIKTAIEKRGDLSRISDSAQLTPLGVNITDDEFIDQIPHWIFPINGNLSGMVLKTLAIIGTQGNPDIRNSILEILRLNNPVNSTFRTLMTDYQFEFDGRRYKKGDSFVVFNNTLLRDEQNFEKADSFIPERWNHLSLDSDQVIMFNQGPQRCPGRDVALSLISTTIKHYLSMSGLPLRSNLTVDLMSFPATVNPCKIQLYKDK